ncbi:Phosphatase and actin regulator 2 [Trichinella murrelli]|uniref:Phosphatase and actin regulator 2 n=1 Tax=Trichinella murrelli TaxID=144512 RepID=A0A0V0TJU8_9BILA|nr:Phosphatase and actin regulator 2 [Trichinella murrelli]
MAEDCASDSCSDGSRHQSEQNCRVARKVRGIKASPSCDSVFFHCALNRLRRRRSTKTDHVQGHKMSGVLLRWFQPWKWRRLKSKTATNKNSANGVTNRLDIENFVDQQQQQQEQQHQHHEVEQRRLDNDISEHEQFDEVIECSSDGSRFVDQCAQSSDQYDGQLALTETEQQLDRITVLPPAYVAVVTKSKTVAHVQSALIVPVDQPEESTSESGVPAPSAPVTFSRRALLHNDADIPPTESEYPEELDCELSPTMSSFSGNVQEVPAKEPDLNAQPVKSALRRRVAFADSLQTDYSASPSPSTSTKKRITTAVSSQVAPQLITTAVGDADDDDLVSSDSDDDEPILFRDRQSENGDEPRLMGALASKVYRKDTISLRDALEGPSSVASLDIPDQTQQERREKMEQISVKLERKLSQRPTAEELEQRNILKDENSPAMSKQIMEQRRRMLLRKLSFRPTIEELKERQIIKFNDYVEVTNAEMYDRRADKPWVRLTPKDKAAIRKELNEYKSFEMEVHEKSRQFTRYAFLVSQFFFYIALHFSFIHLAFIVHKCAKNIPTNILHNSFSLFPPARLRMGYPVSSTGLSSVVLPLQLPTDHLKLTTLAD